MANQKLKLIVDTDPGYDDAMALGVVSKWQNAELLAVTCVNGNVSCDQACINALKVMKVFEREDVPIYKGAQTPIFSHGEQSAGHWHGTDGLHDVTGYIKVNESQVEKEHAVNGLMTLASKNKGEITLVAIGPLTNLALAVKMYPEFPSLLREVVILGGNYQGLGNHTATAEFNFVADPLGAKIVLDEYKCPIYIVPWETCLDFPLSGKFVHEYPKQDNNRSQFFKLIMDGHKAKHGTVFKETADPLAVAVALDRSVILEKLHTFATVETFGALTHGMMVVEKRRKCHMRGSDINKNVTIVTKIDIAKVEKMLMDSVS